MKKRLINLIKQAFEAPAPENRDEFIRLLSERNKNTGNACRTVSEPKENNIEISGKVIRKKKTYWKEIIAAAAAVTVFSAVGIAGVINKNNIGTGTESISVTESSESVKDDNSNSEIQNPKSPESYKAEKVEVSDTSLIGSYGGKSYFFISGHTEEAGADLCSLTGNSEERKILNEEGQEFKMILDITQYGDKILVYGNTLDYEHFEVCVYDSTLTNVLFYTYTTLESEYLSDYCINDEILYLAYSDRIRAFNLNTSECMEIGFDEFGYDSEQILRSGIRILDSGNAVVAVQQISESSDENVDIILLDQNLKYKKTVTDSISAEFLDFSVKNNRITLFYETYADSDSRNPGLIARSYCCDSEENVSYDTENRIFLEDESNGITFIIRCTDEKEKYDILYGDFHNVYGYSSETDTTEKIVSLRDLGLSYEPVVYINGEFFCVLDNTNYFNQICTDPYGNDIISEVVISEVRKEGYVHNTCMNNGHMYILALRNFTPDSEGMIKYEIFDTDLSTGITTQTEFSAYDFLWYNKFYADENYIVFVSMASEKKSIDAYIYIYDWNGNMLKKTEYDKNYSITDIFMTAENEIRVTAKNTA
ncbi:MAG: hypothetical protein Q4D76_19365, partial [Oscillospiraceae bacterium]|nr:hypothetical protein [Oscillospiraceae bacterium]